MNSKIARIKTETIGRNWNASWLNVVPKPDGGVVFLSGKYVELTFELLAEFPHSKVYQSAEIPDWFIAQKCVITKKNPFPHDLVTWGDLVVVSERAKSVIESFDDIIHQFYELPIVDKNDNPVFDQPYYMMFVRRFVEFEKGLPAAPPHPMYLQYVDLELAARAALYHSEQAASAAAELPIFKLPDDRNILFMSVPLLAALREAGCQGLNDYTKLDRHQGAPVSYV